MWKYQFLLFLLLPIPLLAFNAHQPFDITADVLEYEDATQNITAQGHVVIVQSSSTLNADYVRYDRVHRRLLAHGEVILRENGQVAIGDQLDYDLALEKGTLINGKGYAAPWRLQGESWEKNEDYYIGRSASFTSCDLIDPHYHIRSSRIHVIPDRYFWAWNNIFYVDKNPVFYSPFMYKALGPQDVVFQVQPGNDTVKGAFAKTTTTVRLTDHVYDRVYLDRYTIAGTGFGNELDYQQKDYKGSIFGYYINPKGEPELEGAPAASQYDLRLYHWQKLSDSMILQSNINHRQNVSFNNQFFTQDPNQSVNTIDNSTALTYQKKHWNQRLVLESIEAPDATDTSLLANTHVQSASLPRYEMTYYQTPLWSPHVSTSTLDQVLHPNHFGPLLFSANGTAEDFYSRIDGLTRLRANSGVTLTEPITISRNWSFTPTVTPSLTWQDKYDPFTPPVPSTVTVSTGTVIPIGIFRGYQARMGTADTLRYRPLSSLTLDQTYSWTARLEPNGTALDRALQDGGIETNHLSSLMYWRPSRSVQLRSLSGYDFRKIADEDPNAYQQRRIDPWTVEFTYEPYGTTWEYFFRHELGYYPTRSVLWEADIRAHMSHKTVLSTGLLYNKSQPGIVTWNNSAGFYVTPSWRVDANVNALMPNDNTGTFENGTLIQTQFIVTRDMHCWNAQFIYMNLPPFTHQYSVLFNLKLGAEAAKDIANEDLESQFYPWRANQ